MLLFSLITSLFRRASCVTGKTQYAIRNTTDAFTFIELLLTLLIMGICFVPIMRLYSVSLAEIGYVDDMRTAVDLAREEVEKVKNLGLTEEQIKDLGNVASPPVILNAKQWRTLRVVRGDAKPLEFAVYVFREDDLEHPITSAATIVQK